MVDAIILLVTYLLIMVMGLFKGYESKKDEFSDTTVALEVTLIAIYVATFIITLGVVAVSYSEGVGVAIIALNVVVFVISWNVDKFLLLKGKTKEKMKKNKSLKKQLYKNYSKQHADLILKFYKLLLKNNYAEKGVNYKLQPSNTKVLSLSPKELSYIEREEFGYHVVDVTSLFIKFINKNIEYANKKDYADSLESLLLERENAQRIIFLLNVFEDEEKLKFLSRKEGVTQLKLIGKDLNILNYNISENIEKIVELNRKTKTNEMNQEFNLLRKNSFNTIEDMGEIK